MLELLIIIALILLNGLFALSELAVVSSRTHRLKAMAEAGNRSARKALALASNPGRFLSAVQIGITCIAIVNGVYSGEALAPGVALALQGLGISIELSAPIAISAVVALVTYFSVIIGELIPKALALQNAEKIACLVAPAMEIFATLAAPAVWLLDTSTRLFLRALGRDITTRSSVTDEEIQELIVEAERTGVIEADERSMIAGVMRLADRSVASVMTPRREVDWIDLSRGEADIRERLIATDHSRMPVGNGSLDDISGVVQTRELLSGILSGETLEVERHVSKVPLIPESMDALEATSLLREAGVPIALIHDEYGHFVGLVTPTDILQAIAGVFGAELQKEKPHATKRQDGSWLISGSMQVDEMATILQIGLPPQRNYQTVAGLVLANLKHFPEVGERTEALGWRFEVVDLDGRKIDTILATPKNVATHRVV